MTKDELLNTIDHFYGLVAVALLKDEGWRIVKLEVEDTDSGGPEWTTYYVTEEL